ncbi:hypothetical protein DFP72DRAFT_1066445 [Ephemerocybe angulata]|uniref:Uncharacterized protein n=1 Tax=Ephemerocybe angulata TaxID=980116 RepID=A0A8H6M6F7_9AGAR|nr:hypothetical protein DFP72DRAFT_1066445 [Tulosesus angulatus]
MLLDRHEAHLETFAKVLARVPNITKAIAVPAFFQLGMTLAIHKMVEQQFGGHGDLAERNWLAGLLDKYEN